MPQESMTLLHHENINLFAAKRAKGIFKPPRKQQEGQKTEFNKQHKKGRKNVTNNLCIVLLVNLLQDEYSEHLSYYKELLFPSWHTKILPIVISMWFSLHKVVNEKFWMFFFVFFYFRTYIERLGSGWESSREDFSLFSFNTTQSVFFYKVSIVRRNFATPPDSFLRIKWVVKIFLFFSHRLTIDCFCQEGPRHRQKFTKKAINTSIVWRSRFNAPPRGLLDKSLIY